MIKHKTFSYFYQKISSTSISMLCDIPFSMKIIESKKFFTSDKVVRTTIIRYFLDPFQNGALSLLNYCFVRSYCFFYNLLLHYFLFSLRISCGLLKKIIDNFTFWFKINLLIKDIKHLFKVID